MRKDETWGWKAWLWTIGGGALGCCESWSNEGSNDDVDDDDDDDDSSARSIKV